MIEEINYTKEGYKMYKITSSDGDISYGVKEFVCDTPEDLKDLPSCSMGSVAIVISTAEIFMLNSKKEWVKL
jgi:hypothetical protein